MDVHEAACSCGRLRLRATGDPIRISVCHCLACQRRTGSIFGAQARWPAERVAIEGPELVWTRVSDAGEERAQRFCPTCGATVWYTLASAPDVIAVPVGAFADPAFPPPTVSVWEARRHPWAGLPDGIRHVG